MKSPTITLAQLRTIIRKLRMSVAREIPDYRRPYRHALSDVANAAKRLAAKGECEEP